jgi:hypothetical protein
VIVAARELDAKAAYVSCSRGRERSSVFTPDLEHLRQRLPRSGDRPAALDVLFASTCLPSSGSPVQKSRLGNLWESVRSNGASFMHSIRHGLCRSLGRPSLREPELKSPDLDLNPTLEH